MTELILLEDLLIMGQLSCSNQPRANLQPVGRMRWSILVWSALIKTSQYVLPVRMLQGRCVDCLLTWLCWQVAMPVVELLLAGVWPPSQAVLALAKGLIIFTWFELGVQSLSVSHFLLLLLLRQASLDLSGVPGLCYETALKAVAVACSTGMSLSVWEAQGRRQELGLQVCLCEWCWG